MSFSAPKLSRVFVTLLKLAVAIAMVGWLLQSGRMDLRELPKVLGQPLWLGIAVACLVADITASAIRWQLLLFGIQVRERFADIFHFTWIGHLFTNVMPGSIGGDVVKVLYVLRHFPERRVATGLTVLLDRVVGAWTLFLIAATALSIAPPSIIDQPGMRELRVLVWLIVFGTLAAFPVLTSGRVRAFLPAEGFIAEVADAMHAFKHAKRYVLASILASIVNQLLSVLVVYVLARALTGGEARISFAHMAILSPLGMFAMAIPLAPAGVGISQVTFDRLFAWTGVEDPTLGANTATLYQLLYVLTNLGGIGSYLAYGGPPEDETTA